MDRAALIETARALPPVPPAAAAAYVASRDALVAELDRRMGARDDLDRLVGPDNRAMMANNHANHARFVASVLAELDPEVLVDTVLWVFRAYRSHGFGLAYWSAQLATWIEVIRDQLPAHAADIEPLYDWFLVHQPAFVALSDAQLADGV